MVWSDNKIWFKREHSQCREMTSCAAKQNPNTITKKKNQKHKHKHCSQKAIWDKQQLKTMSQCQQDYEQWVQEGVVEPTPTPPIEPTKTQRRAEFDKLMSNTHHQLKDETIVHALLTQNISQCLIKQCKIMEKFHYSECDGNRIDADCEAFTMECKGSIYEEGIIPH